MYVSFFTCLKNVAIDGARASMKTQERKENRGSGIYSFGPVTYKNQQQIGNARNAKLQR
jgi:hypothetical protein